MTPTDRTAAAPPGRMWTRRCRACGRDDLSGAFGRLAMAASAWACPACRSRRYEPVAMAVPASAPDPRECRRVAP